MQVSIFRFTINYLALMLKPNQYYEQIYRAFSNLF